MRAESGFWDEIRKGEGEALGFKPTEILAAELRADVAAARKADLAAKEAIAVAEVSGTMIQIVCESAN